MELQLKASRFGRGRREDGPSSPASSLLALDLSPLPWPPLVLSHWSSCFRHGIVVSCPLVILKCLCSSRASLFTPASRDAGTCSALRGILELRKAPDPARASLGRRQHLGSTPNCGKSGRAAGTGRVTSRNPGVSLVPLSLFP